MYLGPWIQVGGDWEQAFWLYLAISCLLGAALSLNCNPGFRLIYSHLCFSPRVHAPSGLSLPHISSHILPTPQGQAHVLCLQKWISYKVIIPSVMWSGSGSKGAVYRNGISYAILKPGDSQVCRGVLKEASWSFYLLPGKVIIYNINDSFPCVYLVYQLYHHILRHPVWLFYFYHKNHWLIELKLGLNHF